MSARAGLSLVYFVLVENASDEDRADLDERLAGMSSDSRRSKILAAELALSAV